MRLPQIRLESLEEEKKDEAQDKEEVRQTEKERRKNRRENWDKTKGNKRKTQQEEGDRITKKRKLTEDQHPDNNRLLGLGGKGKWDVNFSFLVDRADRNKDIERFQAAEKQEVKEQVQRQDCQ